SGKPGPVATAGRVARGRGPRSQGDTVTSPAPGVGSAPGATAGRSNGRLGLALLVMATAQLMVVLDATIVNVALPHVQRALGFSGTGLDHALTVGFSRAFLVAAGIGLLALLIAIVTIRVSRQDLAGAVPAPQPAAPQP